MRRRARSCCTATIARVHFIPVTVVDQIPHTCELVHEETFGPVIPIVRVPNDIEATIKISNSTAFGLSSGVCTNRLDTVTRFINGLHVGTVNIWEVPGYRIEMSPFGGIKDSGPRLQGRGRVSVAFRKRS